MNKVIMDPWIDMMPSRVRMGLTRELEQELYTKLWRILVVKIKLRILNPIKNAKS